MTEAIPLRELSHHTGRYIELVEQGQRVPIMKKGKLVAVLAPPEPSDRQREWLIKEGLFDPSHPGGPRGWINELEPLSADDVPLSGSLTDALLAMREEERQ